ncbi:ureidoglycolate lyase [Rhizobium sp. SG2393]|uniref:ureidoglycolate lyase n=1 Tax=Rhizobium sp. SG2393 TaxID=3276279 RepID=UPI003673133A
MTEPAGTALTRLSPPIGRAPELLTIEPLTAEAFKPFGSVIEADPASMRLINGGTTERYHALAEAEALGAGAKVIISLFRGRPRSFPYHVGMMERHPEGSQSFSPIDNQDWLVVVAADEGGRPGVPRVFRATGRQGINYRANVWHHPLMTYGAEQDFVVVDRMGPGGNLEEHVYAVPFLIDAPA